MGMGETWVEIVTIEWPAKKKNGGTVDHIQLYRLVYEMLVFYCPVLEHASVLYSFL